MLDKGLENAANADVLESHDLPLPVAGTRLNALVIDDDPCVALALKRLLEALGFDVVLSESGAHAWERIRGGQRFALVVSDVQMPGMDGPSFLEAARCLWPEIDDKAILVTGADVPDSLLAGKVPCVPKPIESDFYKHVLRVLQASR